MRTVRQVINEALYRCNFFQDGQDVPDGYQFNRNFDRFQNVASVIRQEYPFNVQRILTFAGLSDIPFVSIDSMVGSTSFSSPQTGVRYPMRPVSKNVYDNLTIHPITGGIPQFYYFEPPSQVLTYPTQLDEYDFAITGKLNESLTLEPDDSFSDSPLFFIDYLTWKLSHYYSIIYQKGWSSAQHQALKMAKDAVERNTKNDYTIYKPEDVGNMRIYRARNFIRGS